MSNKNQKNSTSCSSRNDTTATPLSKSRKKTAPYGAGLLTGLASTFLWSPVDRALYLHVRNRRPLLTLPNWISPFQGVTHALFGRIVSQGYYYTMMSEYRELAENLIPCPPVCDSTDPQSPRWRRLAVDLTTGLLVGTTSGVILNPVNAAKYHVWTMGEGPKRGAEKPKMSTRSQHIRPHKVKDMSVVGMLRLMYAQGGASSLLRGLGCTIGRDGVFSTMYATSHRLAMQWADRTGSHLDIVSVAVPTRWCVFMWDFCGIWGATVLSSPFNYARNVVYMRSFAARRVRQDPQSGVGHLHGSERLKTERVWVYRRAPARFRLIFQRLISETRGVKGGVLAQGHYFATRLCLGWGTMRVALGMSVGQQLYDWFCDLL